MRHLAILTTLLTASAAHAQDAPPPGEAVPLEPAENGLEISGYVQPELRYERNGGDDELYFQVRRGRAKLEYDLSPALFLLQIDATEGGVQLKDAYAGIALPLPEGMEALLMAGLFKIPFGFDLQHSSSRRVFPERSQMVRNLFPGERDLGVRIDASFADEMIEAQLALQNGLPLGDEFFGAFSEPDADLHKDVTLRVALNVEPITVGVSGLYGRGTRFVEDDPMTPEMEDDFDFPRWGVGGEARLQLDLGAIGGLDVYGELTYSQNLARSSDSDYPPDQDATLKVLAWYVAAVQDLGEHFALGARFDQYRQQDADAENIVTAVAMAIPADDVRVVLAYDFDLADGGNNQGWLRMQVKF
jgi:hypothetical protein